MPNVPFLITCPSCEAKIEVRSAGLIGQIVACPKCGGMIEIVPPQQNELPNTEQNENDNSANVTETIPDTPPKDEAFQAVLNQDFFQENFSSSDSQNFSNAKHFRKNARLIPFLTATFVLLLAFILFLVFKSSTSNLPQQPPQIPPQPTNEITISPDENNNIAQDKNENAEIVSLEKSESSMPGISATSDKTIDEKLAEILSVPNANGINDSLENNVLTITETKPETPENKDETPPDLLPDPFDSLDEDAGVKSASKDFPADASQNKNETQKQQEQRDENKLAPPTKEKIPDVEHEETNPAINIEERLKLPIASIKFEKTPIIRVVETLSDLTGVPMQLDADELRARNISVETPLTLQVQNATVADVIDAALAKTHWTRKIGRREIVFGYSLEETSALQTVHYDLTPIASLETNPISAETAAKWLSELLIAQKNPRMQGAAVTIDGDAVVVSGNRWLQDQSRRFLFSLFYLRDLKPQTKIPPERLAPEVFGWDGVNIPLSFHLVEPIPLKQATRLIAQHTKIRILIDHAALHEQGLSHDLPTSSHVNNGSLDSVLHAILEPLNLTYRIVESNAVEITTPQAAQKNMTIEMQRYAPLTPEKTPKSCVATMKQAFGGEEHWNAKTGGVVVIDETSGYMMVRQTQPQQRAIRLWLGKMHKEEQQNVDTSDHDETENETP
ncbi:MAG: hypothetical protein LBT05_06585 [Planctomycetaceae bacterium]|nr:hypothetical protein [Planctomycetaceae bacterium]